MSFLTDLQSKGLTVEQHVPLAKMLTFQIGGPARYLVRAASSQQAVDALTIAQAHDMPVWTLGGGANCIVADSGFNGLVIKMENRGCVINGTRVNVEAGAPSVYVAQQTITAGLAGAEFLAAIPGSIGGAIRGNAGCFGSETKNIVRDVTVWDGSATRVFSKVECHFRYRQSLFKDRQRQGLTPQWLILSGVLDLRVGNKEDSRARMQTMLKTKNDTQAINTPSAGCIFQNVELTDDFWNNQGHLAWKKDVPEAYIEQGKLPAGWLIDELGLKGKRIGQVEVSRKHANYMINHGGATAEQVIMLISFVKQHVRDHYGIQLVEEIELVGF